MSSSVRPLRLCLAIWVLITAFLIASCAAVSLNGADTSNSPLTYITSFGFLPRGKAELSISSSTPFANSALIGCNSREEEQLLSQTYRLLCADFLNSTLQCSAILTLNASAPQALESASYAPPTSDFYHFYLLRCRPDTFSLEYNLSLSNEKSQLSSDLSPLVAESFSMAAWAGALTLLLLGVLIFGSSTLKTVTVGLLMPFAASKFVMALCTGLFWKGLSDFGSLSSGLVMAYYQASLVYRCLMVLLIMFCSQTLESTSLGQGEVGFRRWIVLAVMGPLFALAVFMWSHFSLMSLIAEIVALTMGTLMIKSRLELSRNLLKASPQSPTLSAASARLEFSFFGTTLIMVVAMFSLMVLAAVNTSTWTYVLLEDLFELSLLSLWTLLHGVHLGLPWSSESSYTDMNSLES